MPGTPWLFFLLPNVLFPFFPVVDRSAFERGVVRRADGKSRSAHRSRVGSARLLHLICYRAVYYYLAIAPADVVDAATWVQFAFSTFLSLFAGFRPVPPDRRDPALFGFKLRSPTIIICFRKTQPIPWRREHLLKDFMQKLFYYPAATWLTKRGCGGGFSHADHSLGGPGDLVSARLHVVLAAGRFLVDVHRRHLLVYFGHPDDDHPARSQIETGAAVKRA
jgi:hypothetical protein